MWTSNEKDRFALANLSPTKSAQNNSQSITSLASFDESDYSFDCDSNTSLIAPSPVIRYAKKWIKPVIVPPRTVNFIRIEGNTDFATVNDCNLIKQWKYEVSSPAYLVNTVISTLEVTGILSQPLVDIISKAEHINSIKFRLCNIKCSISSFSSLIRSIFASSLTFVGCEFSDAQIICDQFFIENRQIRKFVIGPANKEQFSFPCLTNATLQVWRETVPKQIHLVNVQTSFTAEALADIAKIISLKKVFSWRLSTISTELFGIGDIFSLLPVSNVKEVVLASPKVHVIFTNKSHFIFSCSSKELMFAHRIL